MNEIENKKNQPARIPTDEEISQMRQKYIEESAWKVAMEVRIRELSANSKLVLIKSGEGNGFIISE